MNPRPADLESTGQANKAGDSYGSNGAPWRGALVGHGPSSSFARQAGLGTILPPETRKAALPAGAREGRRDDYGAEWALQRAIAHTPAVATTPITALSRAARSCADESVATIQAPSKAA